MRPATLALAALLLFGCQRPPRADSPELAYLMFVEAIRRGESKKAWEALSPATRAAIEARSKEISAASAGVIKDDPALLVLQSGVRPQPAGEVKLLQSDGRAAVVEVSIGTQKQQVKLVKDEQRWTIDLAEAFKP